MTILETQRFDSMANRVLQIIATSLFAALFTIVGLTWWYAYDNGYLPPADLDRSMGGPWNHIAEMTQFVDYICGVGSLAVLASLAWIVTAQTVRLRLMAGAFILTSVSIIGYHVLLLD